MRGDTKLLQHDGQSFYILHCVDFVEIAVLSKTGTHQ